MSCLGLLYPFVRYDVIEKFAADRIFHNNVYKFECLDHVHDLDNMRMVQKLEESDFTLEPRDLFRRLDLTLFNDFDRDLNQIRPNIPARQW